MEHDRIPLYRGSREEAEQYGDAETWDRSFRENVCCAGDIETAIRNGGSAGPVLEKYGLKRTMCVLAHSVKMLGTASTIREDVRSWSAGIRTFSDRQYGRYFKIDAVLPELEAFIGSVQEAFHALGLFDSGHCEPDQWDTDLTGKVLVLSPDSLKEEAWSETNQLWLARGGFGCMPNARGRAVYAVCLGDGEEARWDRSDFVGVLDEQYLPDWARTELDALCQQEQEPAESQTMSGMEMC